jgi:enamine deaminase RidA (YjgF/YER057c/UK114 family)
MNRIRIETENPWEKAFGYARVVRAGSFLAVSGTVASDPDGKPVGSDPYEQTKAILKLIDEALSRAGSSLCDVVRLRVYYVDPAVSEPFFRAFKEAFPDGGPALTTVRTAGLVADTFHLEIEADAVVSDPREEERRQREWDEPSD